MAKHVRKRNGEQTVVEVTPNGVRQVITKQTKYEEVEPDFIKVYLKDLGALYSLTSQEIQLLLILSNWVTYCKDGEGNRVSLSACDRKEILDKMGIQTQQLSRLINNLMAKKILTKLGTGRYFISPLVLARGKWTDVKAIRMQWDYQLDEDGNMTRTETLETTGVNQHLLSLKNNGVLE